MRKLAIIPARGGSKRISRKNIKNFLGRPILSYSIKAAIQSGLFDEVMVSTDDDEIADLAQYYGASVPFMRSEENASDHATTVDAILEVLQEYQKKGVVFSQACCIYPTAPLISPYQLHRAYKKLKNENFDTVVPVTEFSYSIHRALKIGEEGRLEMIDKQNVNVRSQDLPKAYHDAGQFYWFNVKQLEKKKTLFTDNSGTLILENSEVQDIDTIQDWKMAELKFKQLNQFHEDESLFPSRRA